MLSNGTNSSSLVFFDGNLNRCIDRVFQSNRKYSNTCLGPFGLPFDVKT